MAAAYAALSRFGEAAALFERALERTKDVRASILKLKGNTYMVEETEVSDIASLRGAWGPEVCIVDRNLLP